MTESPSHAAPSVLHVTPIVRWAARHAECGLLVTVCVTTRLPLECADARGSRRPSVSARRWLHVPRDPISDDDATDVRALLPLPVVPARDRRVVRPERVD